MPHDPAPSPDDAAFLWDMHDACELIGRFIARKTDADYLSDPMLRSAVERQIEIVGEAARKVSEEFKRCRADIPWRPIMAQRHVLAHEYGEVDPKLVWRVATVHIPRLLGQLKSVLPPRS